MVTPDDEKKEEDEEDPWALVAPPSKGKDWSGKNL